MYVDLEGVMYTIKLICRNCSVLYKNKPITTLYMSISQKYHHPQMDMGNIN